MNNIHIILQGKGGVGKTLAATILSQYLLTKNENISCYDIDPVNSSFASFKALEVEAIDLIDSGVVSLRRFDTLIEHLLAKDNDVVIDCGASSFLPLTTYLKEQRVVDFLSESGKSVFIHNLIAGGQSSVDTMNGLNLMLRTFGKNTNIVAWLNPIQGEISHNGKHFFDSKIYQNNKDMLYGILEMPEYHSFFIESFRQMLERKLTFEEAINTPDIFLMERQRISLIQSDYYKILDSLFAMESIKEEAS